MKIVLDTPVVELDVTRTSVTIDHYVVYPSSQIVINNRDGSSKTLQVGGLFKTTKDAYDAFEAGLLFDTKDEYQTGGVTARAQTKKDADKAVNGLKQTAKDSN